MAHVYRADTIGSLLRPPYLKLAREQFEAGQLEAAAYKEVEDRAVDQAIAMQEGVGLNVVTDGELRRHTFIDQLTEQVEGLTPDSGDSGHIPVPFSKQLFQRATNYDTFLLEYDDERSGSFSALGDVPDDKTVVLGLVSTKFDRMEPADQLAARISEASGFFPREQLALSTQCGFASAGPGNQISEDAQENKLRLVGEVADRFWG